MIQTSFEPSQATPGEYSPDAQARVSRATFGCASGERGLINFGELPKRRNRGETARWNNDKTTAR
jgi:hypothetical protein